MNKVELTSKVIITLESGKKVTPGIAFLIENTLNNLGLIEVGNDKVALRFHFKSSQEV